MIDRLIGMFGLARKKSYDELYLDYCELKNKLELREGDIRCFMEKIRERGIEIKEIEDRHKEEMTEMKNRYADEIQKRLELIKLMEDRHET